MIVSAGIYLLHNIPQLLLNLLLGALESLPQIIAHATPLQKHLERLLRIPDLHDAVDVLGRAAQQCSLEDVVGDLGFVLVQQCEVDVALDVGGEPWLEGGGACLLSLAVEI